MKQDITEIEVNGVKYVPKDSVTASTAVDKNMVIVRCKSAGVFFGAIKNPAALQDHLEQGVIALTNARRLWYWSGAASLSQLAVDGTSKPKECKFPVAVPEITLLEVIEVIPCTVVAINSLNSVSVWKQ